MYYFQNYAKCRDCKEVDVANHKAFISFRTVAVRTYNQLKNGTLKARSVQFGTVNIMKNDLPEGIVWDKLPVIACYPPASQRSLREPAILTDDISVEKIASMISRLESPESVHPDTDTSVTNTDEQPGEGLEQRGLEEDKHTPQEQGQHGDL